MELHGTSVQKNLAVRDGKCLINGVRNFNTVSYECDNEQTMYKCIENTATLLIFAREVKAILFFFFSKSKQYNKTVLNA